MANNNPLGIGAPDQGASWWDITKEGGKTTYGVGFPLFDETVTKPLIKKTLEDSLKVVKNVTGLEGTTTVQFPITDISDGKKIVEGVANNFNFWNSLGKLAGPVLLPWTLYKAYMAIKHRNKTPNLNEIDNDDKVPGWVKWLTRIGGVYGVLMYLKEKLAIFYGALSKAIKISMNGVKTIGEAISKVTSKVYSRIRAYYPSWLPKVNVSLPIDPYNVYVFFASPLFIALASIVDFASNLYLAKKAGEGWKKSIGYALKNAYVARMLDLAFGSPIKLLTKLVYRKSDKVRNSILDAIQRYNNGAASKWDKVKVYLAKYAKVGPYA